MKERIEALKKEIEEIKGTVEDLKKTVATLKGQNETLRNGINLIGRRIVSLEQRTQGRMDRPMPSDPTSASWFTDLLAGLGKKQE